MLNAITIGKNSYSRFVINIAIIVKPWYRWECCLTIIVGDMMVPSTSAQYSISTSVTFPSRDSQGRSPFSVHIIAISSAFTPPIGNGCMYSYACMQDLILVTFLFAPVSFCTESVQILNEVLLSGGF